MMETRAMQAAPLISVIMPACNAAPHIGEAIRSLLDQSFDAFEVLVIDDGSTDDTARIAASFADPRVRVFRHPVNLGIAAATNLGMAMARGDLLARLDADDTAMPDRLATQWAFMRDRGDITVVGSDMTLFGAADGDTDAPAEDGRIKACFLAAAGNVFNPTACFRRDFVLSRAVRYNPAYAAAEDLAFWIDCMRAGARFANIKRPLVRWRTHGTGLTGSARRFLPRIMTELCADFFPWLPRHDVVPLARLLAGADLTRTAADQALASCTKATVPHPSVFGEDRALVTAIVRARAEALAAALRAPPPRLPPNPGNAAGRGARIDPPQGQG
jgi:hypothetical protein